MREQEKAAEEARKKREEEAIREALRVAVRELFTAPPPAKLADAPMKFYEIIPQTTHTTTLVWLHGNGELPQEYTSMFDRAFLRDYPHVRLVLPTPPHDRALVTDPQLWFDLDEAQWKEQYLTGEYTQLDLNQADLDVMQQIKESADWVAACVEKELKRVPASRVVLAGFSHGGVVVSYVTYTKLTAQLAGCI